MILIAFLMLIYIYRILQHYIKIRIVPKAVILLVVFISVVPGIAYTSVYFYEDVRFKASDWLYENMEDRAYILSETANVIDVPIVDPDNPHPNSSKYFRYISFNFYDLHVTEQISEELEDHIAQADYIFIPSRRVFANHTCYVPEEDGEFTKKSFFIGYEMDRCNKLEKDYPQVNSYYDRLFTGQLGFEQVAEFSSYPRIELFGYTLAEFPDELSEETWTVFDHPVIRIYKRIQH